MRIVLLGPPGSGKGTQAKRVASHYRIPHVTSTSALADIAREDSELGRLVKETIEVNRVSDDLLAAALRVRLSQPDAAVGFVLDGFPRTVPQAETLEAVLDGIGRPIDVVILIDVDPDELMERLVGRLTCEGCGTIYNAYANPPTVDGVCDRCGGRVSRRPDDYEETIGNRLRIFESQTAQLIQHFKLRGKLRRVSGEGEPDKVFADIRHIIDSTPRTVIEMEPVSEKAEPITVLPSGLPLPPARKKAKVPAKPARPEAPPKVAPAKPAPAAPKKAAVVLAEKAPAEKAPVAKAPVEKPAGKKAVPAAKPAVAKAEPKKAPPKAGTAKKPAGKKPAVKTAAKPATAKKAATKKPPVRTAPRKAAPKAGAPKKPAGKRPAAKAVPMKPAVKKPGGRTAAKTAAPKKAAPKVPAPKKAALKVPAAKKAAPKKVPAKKVPVKKAPARKTAKPKRR